MKPKVAEAYLRLSERLSTVAAVSMSIILGFLVAAAFSGAEAVCATETPMLILAVGLGSLLLSIGAGVSALWEYAYYEEELPGISWLTTRKKEKEKNMSVDAIQKKRVSVIQSRIIVVQVLLLLLGEAIILASIFWKLAQ
ncbi:MAG: hypothetical protein KKA28_18775 [Planctomycetes bacterium]|nr:hypothetical protein [Planctomycetota bacterium]